MPLTEWNGREIQAMLERAEILAVNETTLAAAEEARKDHWWDPETGHLERETISEPARPVPGAVSGRFGTTRRRGFYGLIQEYRQPFLRPVADRVFPTLHERLRRRLL